MLQELSIVDIKKNGILLKKYDLGELFKATLYKYNNKKLLISELLSDVNIIEINSDDGKIEILNYLKRQSSSLYK